MLRVQIEYHAHIYIAGWGLMTDGFGKAGNVCQSIHTLEIAFLVLRVQNEYYVHIYIAGQELMLLKKPRMSCLSIHAFSNSRMLRA